MVAGKYYSRGSVLEMARAFGDSIVVADVAQSKFESLLKEVSALRLRNQSIAEERDIALAECASLKKQLDIAKAASAELATTLAETRSLSDIAAEFLSPSKSRDAKPSNDNRKLVTA